MSKKYPRYVYLDMSAKIENYICVIKFKKMETIFYEIMHQNRLMKKLHSITIHSYLSFGSSIPVFINWQ